MKNRNLLGKLGDILVGKGFYIVLFLCVATIGMSGYYLYQTMSPVRDGILPTGGDTSVILPDSEANGPEPQGSLSTAGQPPVEDEPAPVVKPKPTPAKPDDPEDETKPQPGEEPAGEQTLEKLVFTRPVKGELLRDFSVETLALDPTMGDWRTHNGLDLSADVGLKVMAMAAGTVTEVYEDGLMGTTVVINHGGGLLSTYSNLNEEAAVKPGDTVDTGTVVGTVGDSAIAESGMEPHLHLEVWKDGDPVNPETYLPEQ